MKHITSYLLLFLMTFANQNMLAQQDTSNATPEPFWVYMITQKGKKKIDLLSEALRYQHSMRGDRSLSRYLTQSGTVELLEVMSSKNKWRFERFAALYYIHHVLIEGDTSRKELIYLTIDTLKEIDDSYLNRSYSSEKEKQKMIQEDLQIARKYDQAIDGYYAIIRRYTEEYVKKGPWRAKLNYKRRMKKQHIRWYYSYES